MRDFKADLARYGDAPAVVRLVQNQGLWASAQYRFSRWVRLSPRRRWLRPLDFVWFKLVEITTGISIAGKARIGPGLQIGHFGGIVVGPDVVVGANCVLGHGVTLGTTAGRRPGSPTIGDGTYIASGAAVVGPVVVGERVQIGANAVVNRDVPSNSIAVGVPAVARPKPPDSAPEPGASEVGLEVG